MSGQRVHERLLDARVGALARIAHAEVDHARRRARPRAASPRPGGRTDTSSCAASTGERRISRDGIGQEGAQHLEATGRARRSPPARRGGGRSAVAPGPKLTASTPASANSATGVQACFGSTSRSPAARRRPTSGVVDDDGRGRRVARDRDLVRAGLARRARGCASPPRPATGRARSGGSGVARRPVGDDVRRDAARDAASPSPTSTNVRPESSTSRGGTGRTRARPSTARSIAFTPGPRARGVGALAVPDELGDEVPEAAGVERVVRRLEHDREVGLEHLRDGGEERRERALRLGELLAREEEKPEVEASGVPASSSAARELDHHRDAALHVARPEAVDAAVLDPPRDVVPAPARCRGGRRGGRAGARSAPSRHVEERRPRRARAGAGRSARRPRPRPPLPPRGGSPTGCPRARASSRRGGSRGRPDRARRQRIPGACGHNQPRCLANAGSRARGRARARVLRPRAPARRRPGRRAGRAAGAHAHRRRRAGRRARPAPRPRPIRARTSGRASSPS